MFKAMFSYKKGKETFAVKADDFQTQVVMSKNNVDSVVVTAPKPFNVEIRKDDGRLPEVIKAQSTAPKE
ncbi:MAG: hypothetical protein PHY48_15365 [Candidatus Cloacimonetes bacterium]|nr:hypothetical protein [Candidatus Cloacimonadota bacterium]